MNIYEPIEYLHQLALTKNHNVHTLKLEAFERAYFKKRITPDLRLYSMASEQQKDLLNQIINTPPITDEEYEACLDRLIASSDDDRNILLNSMKEAHLNEIKRQELQQFIDVHRALTIHHTLEILKVKRQIKAFVETNKIPPSFNSKIVKTKQQYGNYLCQLHRHLVLTAPLGAANFDSLIREHHGLLPHSPQLSHLHAAQPTAVLDATVPYLYPYRPDKKTS
ncbi:hypothetical protein N8483_00060 [Synechococcus sp. AH-601-O20]|nr:hypothetical protein [Synechococcus sp. AH-601-O20]